MDIKRNSKVKVGIIALIVALGFLYQYKYINEFPSHIHAWAQSDRYAISLGFIDNGFNFFKPQTFVYNHQFPDDWKSPSEKTITAVDFPIYDYLSAILMKVFGNTSPWVFRLYILLYSFLGLFYLFKLSYSISKNSVKSLFVLVFAASSPLFVYYQGGFLPTIPSLANTIIGIYLYFKHLKSQQNKDFYLSLAFLTLATLARTTFAIPLVAVFAIELIRVLKKETKFLNRLIPIALSIMVPLLYLFYNGYLRERYGSIFLNQLLPASSFDQVKEILNSVYSNWFYHYFTIYHYLVFISISLVSVSFFVLRKSKTHLSKIYFLLYILVYLLGCFIFSIAMLRQFPAHDYYFLDTFYLPIVLMLVVLLSLIPEPRKSVHRKMLQTAFCLIAFLLLFQPLKTQKERRATGYWDRTEATINNFSGSSEFLDSLDIPKSSKILVIDAIAPNIPFLLMERKGYAIMNSNRENIKEALSWEYDYIVMQNEYFISDIYTPYPEILLKLNKIADNGKISVCIPVNNNPQSLSEYLGLNSENALLRKYVDFESKPGDKWQNIRSTGRYSFSGTRSGYISSSNTFGLTYKTKNLSQLKHNAHTLYFSSYFLRETIANCEIVVSVKSDGKNIYYKSYNLNYLMTQLRSWEKVSLVFQIPEIKSGDFEFAIFIWNTGKAELYYDNLEIAIY